MRTKLILSVLLLLALLFLLNWAAGRYLAAIVTQQFDLFVGAQEQMEYSYEKVSVNPVFGSLTIRDLAFRQQGSLMEVERITGSLTHADLWRVIRKGSRDPLAHIHSFRIRMEDLAIHDAPAGTADLSLRESDPRQWLFGESMMVRRVNLMYNGRMDELLHITDSQEPPKHNHRISISLDDVEFHEEIPEILMEMPVFSGYRFPDSMDQVALQIRYRADRKTATLSSLRITAPGLSLRTSGEISYGDLGWPSEPESWKLNYMLHAATRELARLPLPGKLGGFAMDTLSVTSNISFDHEQRDRHPFSLPGETSLYIENVRWYPSAALIQEYGMFLNMFGLPDKELPIHSIRANWSNISETLRIDNTVISTEPFDARINMTVAIPPDERATILDGAVTFSRTSAAFSDFTDGVEGLFQIELPRRDGRLHFEFHGDPQAPTFRFLEELSEIPERLTP